MENRVVVGPIEKLWGGRGGRGQWRDRIDRQASGELFYGLIGVDDGLIVFWLDVLV
jgi:hypothetical protein